MTKHRQLPMMAPKAQVHKELLSLLRNAKPPLRKAILKEADKALVHTICEICDNTLAGNIPLSPAQKNKIGKHKTVLRRLARKGESWQQKKKTLVQSGGSFLPLLLSVLAPFIASAIFDK